MSSDGCLFCRLAADGDHVASSRGFIAIRDVNPKADVHLLVLPRRHLETFRDVGLLSADETKEMLEFVAATARDAGLADYTLRVNVGAAAGQEVFHLHWHILGSPPP